jgi:hypothetical protein
MACFELFAIWSPNSGLTPSSEKLCDVTIEWREKVKSKLWKMDDVKILI